MTDPEEALARIATVECRLMMARMSPEACKHQQKYALRMLCEPFTLIERPCLECPRYEAGARMRRNWGGPGGKRKAGDFVPQRQQEQDRRFNHERGVKAARARWGFNGEAEKA